MGGWKGLVWEGGDRGHGGGRREGGRGGGGGGQGVNITHWTVWAAEATEDVSDSFSSCLFVSSVAFSQHSTYWLTDDWLTFWTG